MLKDHSQLQLSLSPYQGLYDAIIPADHLLRRIKENIGQGDQSVSCADLCKNCIDCQQGIAQSRHIKCHVALTFPAFFFVFWQYRRKGISQCRQ